MYKINVAERAFIVFCAIVFTLLGVLLEEFSILSSDIFNGSRLEEFSYLFIPIISIILGLTGATIARLSTEWLISFAWMRRWILGDRDVEGHWLMRTYAKFESNDEKRRGENYHEVSPIEKHAVTFITFDTYSREFIATGTRIGDDGKAFTTISEFAHLRTTSPRVEYLNYFTLRMSGDKNLSGYVYGTFFSTHNLDKTPSRFDAELDLKSDSTSYQQHGEKISKKSVKKYTKKYGNYWIRFFLKDIELIYGQYNQDANSRMSFEDYAEQQKAIRLLLDDGDIGHQYRSKIENIVILWKKIRIISKKKLKPYMARFKSK